MFSFFQGRERERERESEKKREKDIKNETSVGERKVGREIRVEERGGENHREGEGETGVRQR